MRFHAGCFSLIPLFLTSVSAAPLTINRRAISQDLLDQLSFFEQYSAAAYCSSNNVATSDTAITCSAGNCPEVQSAGAESLLEFQNQGSGDSTGFVALDHTNKLIVLSFRGTKSFANIVADINLVMTPWPEICSTCTAHAGFLESWTAVKSQVQPVIANAKASNPSYQIVATGHSLGAAITTLAAADLRKNAGLDVALYTYGSPMTGNYALAAFITAQTSNNFRVTHADDPVPRLPGYPFFAHVSPEYWITSPSNINVTTSDIKVSTGNIDLKGNQGQLGFNPDDHGFYFNSVSAC